MALTQTDLDALDAAISTSELEVEMSDGRRVRYRSISELLAARAHVASVVATGTTGTRRSFTYRPVTSRGD